MGAVAGKTLRLRAQGLPLRRVSGLRYRQARLSILNCQRLGSQALSVYHSSPNKEEASEMGVSYPRVLRSSLFRDKWFPLPIREGFMKTS